MKDSVYYLWQMALEDSLTLMDHIILDNSDATWRMDLESILIQMATSFFKVNGEKEEIYRNLYFYFEPIL